MTPPFESKWNRDADHLSDLARTDVPRGDWTADLSSNADALQGRTSNPASGEPPTDAAYEVYRQAIDAFEPEDGSTLLRAVFASWTGHVLVALPLFFYGSFLALQPDPAPRQSDARKPIAAKFVFEKKEKPAEPVIQTASAEPVEQPRAERPKPKPAAQKKPKRVAKRTRKTAPKRARKTVAEPPKPQPPAPTFVAPAATQGEGPTVAVLQVPDPALAAGPASQPVDIAVAVPANSEVDLKGALAAYKKKLSRALKKDYTYPRAARRAGLEGRAIVRILIDASGQVLSVELASSSGHPILDNAALEAARSVKRVPAAPDNLMWGQRHIKVPFKFRSA